MSQAIYHIAATEGADNTTSNTTAPIPDDAIAIKVDPNTLVDKQTLLSSLAIACNFPDYFSNNWDSAYDCLTDSDTRHFKLDLHDAEKINTEDLNAFRSLIEDAYEDFGKPQLWIISPQNNTQDETQSHTKD